MNNRRAKQDNSFNTISSKYFYAFTFWHCFANSIYNRRYLPSSVYYWLFCGQIWAASSTRIVDETQPEQLFVLYEMRNNCLPSPSTIFWKTFLMYIVQVTCPVKLIGKIKINSTKSNDAHLLQRVLTFWFKVRCHLQQWFSAYYWCSIWNSFLLSLFFWVCDKAGNSEIIFL